MILVKISSIYQSKVSSQWFTKKIKSFLSLKDKSPYPSCQIYKLTCVCDETHIGKTIRNVDIGWNEHEDIRNESGPANHLRESMNNKLKW